MGVPCEADSKNGEDNGVQKLMACFNVMFLLLFIYDYVDKTNKLFPENREYFCDILLTIYERITDGYAPLERRFYLQKCDVYNVL